MEENKQLMDEETKAENTGKDGHGRNWVTDMYDKINVSVNALNIALVVLMVFILGVIILASKH